MSVRTNKIIALLIALLVGVGVVGNAWSDPYPQRRWNRDYRSDGNRYGWGYPHQDGFYRGYAAPWGQYGSPYYGYGRPYGRPFAYPPPPYYGPPNPHYGTRAPTWGFTFTY